MLSAKREPRKILLCFNCDSGMEAMSFFGSLVGETILPFSAVLISRDMDFSFNIMRLATKSLTRGP